MIKPTAEQMEAYKQESKISLDCGQFWDYFESKGWLVGKTPMKDWKAAMRNWARNNNNPQLAQVKVEPVRINYRDFSDGSTKEIKNDRNLAIFALKLISWLSRGSRFDGDIPAFKEKLRYSGRTYAEKELIDAYIDGRIEGKGSEPAWMQGAI